MTLSKSLKLAGVLSAVGLVSGVVTGFALPRVQQPAQPDVVAAAPRVEVPPAAGAANPPPAAQRTPQPAAQPPQRSAPDTAVQWTAQPQRVERREPPPTAAAPAPRPAAPQVVTQTHDLPPGERAIYNRLLVVDAATFRALGRTLRLADVDALALDQTCTDERSQTWPCGRRAHAAMAAFVRQRSVTCVEVASEGRNATVRCRLGRTDLSAWLVEQGWARPVAGAERLASLADGARNARTGQFTPDSAVLMRE